MNSCEDLKIHLEPTVTATPTKTPPLEEKVLIIATDMKIVDDQQPVTTTESPLAAEEKE